MPRRNFWKDLSEMQILSILESVISTLRLKMIRENNNDKIYYKSALYCRHKDAMIIDAEI